MTYLIQSPCYFLLFFPNTPTNAKTSESLFTAQNMVAFVVFPNYTGGSCNEARESRWHDGEEIWNNHFLIKYKSMQWIVWSNENQEDTKVNLITILLLWVATLVSLRDEVT